MRFVFFPLLLALIWLGPVMGEERPQGAPSRGKVTVFLDTGCPIARYHTRTLRELHTAFAPQGIEFEAFFPNRLARAVSIDRFAKKFLIPFPVHPDPKQKMARDFGATTVPEVFLRNAAGELVYQGRIDDIFGAVGRKRPKANHHDLKEALKALIAGKTVARSKTEPVGCPITFQQSPPKTPDSR